MDKKTEKMLIIALLVLNLLLGLYIAFIKPSAYTLEAMKAGGRENMQMAKQLYKSDVYIQQQKTTLEQILGSMNQPTAVQPEAAVQPETVEEIPAVTE